MVVLRSQTSKLGVGGMVLGERVRDDESNMKNGTKGDVFEER